MFLLKAGTRVRFGRMPGMFGCFVCLTTEQRLIYSFFGALKLGLGLNNSRKLRNHSIHLLPAALLPVAGVDPQVRGRAGFSGICRTHFLVPIGFERTSPLVRHPYARGLTRPPLPLLYCCSRHFVMLLKRRRCCYFADNL